VDESRTIEIGIGLHAGDAFAARSAMKRGSNFRF
jgi:hypothetical protein